MSTQAQASTPGAPGATTPANGIVKVVCASLIGTAVEWYDFFLYGSAAALVFGKLFFPESEPVTATLLAFGTYALGFVARPLGGVVFGHFGHQVAAGQFADIAAQEMYRVPQEGDPLEEVVLGELEGGRHEVGPGRYETLVEVGRHQDLPMLTFTSPHGHEHVEHTQPSDPYLDTLRTGLRESRGWDEQQVTAYFDGVVVRRTGPDATSPFEG